MKNTISLNRTFLSGPTVYAWEFSSQYAWLECFPFAYAFAFTCNFLKLDFNGLYLA